MGDKKLIGFEIVQVIMKKVKIIKGQIKVAQDRQ
jgi:septum formation topological specificity factor MinE